MEFTNTSVYNFKNALYGMRNPLNSWHNFDSTETTIGPKDLNLAQRLILAGPEHMKFMRQIFVSCDITGPLYWWKEMDQYKVGTTTNSMSTMHKLTSEPITRKNFTIDFTDLPVGKNLTTRDYTTGIIAYCEQLRLKYLETGDAHYWRLLVQILPNGWNQTRTWTGNYSILRSIYHQRAGHKLTEWEEVRNWIESLPYAEELIILEAK